MLKKILLIILALITSFISYDLFLRYSPFEYGLASSVYNSKVGMWHKNNFSDYKIKDCYRTKFYFDEEGRVKSIFKYDKNKKDVIILGDSRIEAQMVKNRNIIHNQLALQYKNKYNFLNYGLYGTGPVQQYIILKEKVKNLKNVKYILEFVAIDGDLTDSVFNNNNLGRPLVKINFHSLDNYDIIWPRKPTIYDKVGDVLSNYQLYSYIKKTVYMIKKEIKYLVDFDHKNQIENSKQIDYNQAWLNLKGSIYQIYKLAKKHNIKYKVIIFYETEKNRDILINFLQQYNIEYTILNNNVELKGFSCDKHWNDDTHKKIAQYLKNIKFLE